MPDINNRDEYYYDGYENSNSGLIRLVTAVATATLRKKFRHLQRLRGLICDIFLPVGKEYDPKTRTGSVYNREDHKYEYTDVPNMENVNLVVSNLMDLMRMDAETSMDNILIGKEVYAFTNLSENELCAIPNNSKIVVKYNHKNYVFFVWDVTAIDSPYDDGKAVFRLTLHPHS